MAVMGSDDIVVGKSPSDRTSKTVILEDLAKRAGVSATAESSASAQERQCGARTEQPCYGGATSIPQPFLHLVGCREPGVKSGTKSPAPAGRSRAR
jgi:hypothetical protein